LLVVLHLNDGEPMPLTRDGLPGRGSGVFALPTGAEMIVTLSPRDRERPRRSPPSISRAVAAATFGACLAYTPDPCRRRHGLLRYQPSARVDDPRIIMIWR
jgi:hypothetical protein